jgi:hypothetical protein
MGDRGRFRGYSRCMRSLMVAFALVSSSLAIGALGFHWLGAQDWNDAFVKAALLQSGLAPVPESLLNTAAGRAFGWVYGLYAGIVLLMALGILLILIVRSISRFSSPPS